jgi:hypothetical protein
VRNLSMKFYAKFKVPGNNVIPYESIPERYGRDLANQLACNSGNEQCLQDTNTLVKLFLDNNQKIPQGLEHIYCSGMRTASKEYFVKMFQRMQATPTATETPFKLILINGIGCINDKQLLFDYLEAAMGDGNSVTFSIAQRKACFTSVLQSEVGLEAMMNFLAKHEDVARLRYNYTLLEMYTIVANAVKSKDEQWKLQSHMLTHSALSGNDFQSITRIMTANLQQQDQMRYRSQIEIVNRMFQD